MSNTLKNWLTGIANSIRTKRGITNTYSDATIIDHILDTSEIQSSGLDRNNEDCPGGFLCHGGTNANGTIRLCNVITSNGWWTVSFWIRGSQGTTGGLKVDICDAGIERVSVNADNSWRYVEKTVYVSNYTNDLYHFVDFSEIENIYLYIKDIKIYKSERIKPKDFASEIENLNIDVDDSSNIYYDISQPLAITHDDYIYGTISNDKVGYGSTYVVFQDRVFSSIGYNAFETAKDTVKYVAFPTPPTGVDMSITSVGDGIFVNCSKLKAVFFPQEYGPFISSFFNNCPELEAIVLTGTSPKVPCNFYTECPKLSKIIIKKGSVLTIEGEDYYPEQANIIRQMIVEV